jgi:hypothetical protein
VKPRRQMTRPMRPLWILLPSLLAAGGAAAAEPSPDVPRSVTELWADFDPRRDPLETEVIREWREDGGVYRHVRYLVGTFKGVPARMTAIYGFPEGADNTGPVPGVMHIHGGGQRGSLSEVKLLVTRGYAGLSVNWGGRGGGSGPFNAVEGAKDGDPNTDWGAVDPSQCNVQGYGTLLPGPLQFYDDREHPKNNNWYLLTFGCRRGLTFLERQGEVDPERLGVHGYSMGGNLTMYVAGTDGRVKAAVPAVGGQGWTWEPHAFLAGTAPPQVRVKGDVDLFRRTLGFESYAPLIRCPVLHRSATNDFHGWMDDVYRTNALIPGQPLRFSWTVHMNHRLVPEVAVAMPLWFDQHLRGGPALPETPAATLLLQTDDGTPRLRVVPDARWPVARCDMHYAIDPDPRARFWRTATATRDGDAFVAKLPVEDLTRPLFAFANVFHELPEPVSLAPLPGHREPVRAICLSSDLRTAQAPALAAAGVRSTALQPGPIDDFTHGWRDWYVLNEVHPSLWQRWTRKITDPAWRGPAGARLTLTVEMPRTNRLTIVVIENEWRHERGPRRSFACTREITGSVDPQTIAYSVADFTPLEGTAGVLESWAQLDQLGICASFGPAGGPAQWDGPPPVFRRVAWDE